MNFNLALLIYLLLIFKILYHRKIIYQVLLIVANYVQLKVKQNEMNKIRTTNDKSVLIIKVNSQVYLFFLSKNVFFSFLGILN